MGRTNATACFRELGAELKKRRETAGVTAAQIARRTGWDPSRVSRIESGHLGTSTSDVVFYLGACGIHPPEAKEVFELCEIADNNQGYWLSPHGEWLQGSLASLLYHEYTADRTVWYEPMVVPGLLQTRAYASVWIFRSAAHSRRSLDEALKIRMRRQEGLHRPRPGRFEFFVHERALRIQVGSSAIMHEQLLHIVLIAALGHVSLRIIPESASDEAAFGGPFQLFEYRDHAPLLYLDSFLTGMFIEDKDVVGDYYRHLIPELRSLALDEGESRVFAANLADEYDRGRPEQHAPIGLEEEQL